MNLRGLGGVDTMLAIDAAMDGRPAASCSELSTWCSWENLSPEEAMAAGMFASHRPLDLLEVVRQWVCSGTRRCE